MRRGVHRRPTHRSDKLSYEQRERLPNSAFADPVHRKYPIHDRIHARNALARVSQFGTKKEKALVRRAVYARYGIV